MSDKIWDLLLRVSKSCTVKMNSKTLKNGTCYLCLKDFKQKEQVYECPVCNSGVCLYQTNDCLGFFIYLKTYRRCMICRNEI